MTPAQAYIGSTGTRTTRANASVAKGDVPLRPDPESHEYRSPTDAELSAAIGRSIERGTMILVDDDVLAWMREQAAAAPSEDAATEAPAPQSVADEYGAQAAAAAATPWAGGDAEFGAEFGSGLDDGYSLDQDHTTDIDQDMASGQGMSS